MAPHVDNDTRGWIMAAVSGAACIFGACVICVDTLVRLYPGKRDFQIEKSDTFLSSSLSLSFGVMLFSSLYNMLPASKTSLMDGGMSPMKASWILIACFLGGVVGIQVLSRIFHHFMPSHVVDCEHTHDDEEEGRRSLDEHDHVHHSHPTLGESQYSNQTSDNLHKSFVDGDASAKKGSHETDSLLAHGRPPKLTTRVSSFLKGVKTHCDGRGPCYGYSDPCGNKCFKIKARGPSSSRTRSTYGSMHQDLAEQSDEDRSEVADRCRKVRSLGNKGQLHDRAMENSHSHNPEHEHEHDDGHSDAESVASTAASPLRESAHGHNHHHHHSHNHQLSHSHNGPKEHHHHVPSNAFLSIGLQTSFAIALHKLPEGFITYATNHANPELGLSIFVALFIHNITEGFALALPLFLAIQSRFKAIIAASILGGASQPLGAGIAALWLNAVGDGGQLSNDVVYGCMFAITSGIMTNVALQLFSESLSLTHSKTLCIVWAFIGMGALGCSNALTAGKSH